MFEVKAMMLRQGYVPEGCTLDGNLIWGLINRSEDPCSGCNESRNICKGRPADENYMEKARKENSCGNQDRPNI